MCRRTEWTRYFDQIIIINTDYISAFLTCHSEQEIRLWNRSVCSLPVWKRRLSVSVSAAWWWWCLLCCVHQSAGTFEEVEKPSAAYQKTRPVEAGQNKELVQCCFLLYKASEHLIVVSVQLETVPAASKLASRTLRSRRRRRIRRERRKSALDGRPRRSRSRRRRAGSRRCVRLSRRTHTLNTHYQMDRIWKLRPFHINTKIVNIEWREFWSRVRWSNRRNDFRVKKLYQFIKRDLKIQLNLLNDETQERRNSVSDVNVFR